MKIYMKVFWLSWESRVLNHGCGGYGGATVGETIFKYMYEYIKKSSREPLAKKFQIYMETSRQSAESSL
jgi:hypothetical protein